MLAVHLLSACLGIAWVFHFSVKYGALLVVVRYTVNHR